MNDNLPASELPERAIANDRLAQSLEAAKELVSFRVGYEVEVAGLEPIDREGHTHIRVHWRRKPVELRVVH